MNLIGSQTSVFSDTMNRIKNKKKLLLENSVKLEVIQSIKEIQAQLTQINFLDVLSMMDGSNPLKKDIEGFETVLSELRTSIETLVSDNHFDIEEEPDVEEEPEEPKKSEDTDKDKFKLSGEDKNTKEDKK